MIQLYVSVRNRDALRDATGDPWNGRTLEWLTASPPAAYNFAVIPEVRDIDAFHDMKQRGTAYRRPARYEDIHMPKNTGAGVIIGALSFVFGFAAVWYIWWLVAVSAIGIVIAVVARSSDDDTDYIIPAAEVERIEAVHLAQRARAVSHDTEGTEPQVAPLPGVPA
jgi:cytochrome o ubiquinol oxidase subunit 1